MQFIGVATALIVVIVVLAGGIVTVTNPITLPFHSYVQDVAIAVGLLSVAHGIDKGSRP